VKPELLARAADRVKPYAKVTTGGADIVVRRWMPLDFDPVRRLPAPTAWRPSLGV
jgi:hypothetical protein